MDLRDYFEKFCTAKLAEKRSPKTIKIYRDQVERFLRWCDHQGIGGLDLVGQTGAEVIEEFLIALDCDGLSPASVAMYFNSLRAVYHWTFDRYEEEMEGKSPFKWLQHPTAPELLPKNISLNEVLLLLHSIKPKSWVDHRDKLLIKVLFYTGMRASEIVSLSLADVDLSQRLLRVMRWKIHKEEFVPIAKSMVPDFREWIEVHRPQVNNDWLWTSKQINHTSADTLVVRGLQQMVLRRCANAGLPKYYPHAFRHGCAINIIKRGGDISLVQKILGHRDITTSQIYLRYDMDTVVSLYDRVFD